VNIYAKSTSGAADDETLLEDAAVKYPRSWSLDGRILAYTRNDSKAGFVQSQIWILPLFGDREPFPFLPSSFSEESPEFSPDGRWIAYESNESGNFQIYVAAFPGAETRVQVSASGGISPAWRADGKELFYLDPTGRLTAVEVNVIGRRLEVGTSQSLFLTRAATTGVGTRPFDVSRGADRFVLTTTGDVSPLPCTLVVNWTEELKKK
jgi:Tol biopolymer transport system component